MSHISLQTCLISHCRVQQDGVLERDEVNRWDMISIQVVLEYRMSDLLSHALHGMLGYM